MDLTNDILFDYYKDFDDESYYYYCLNNIDIEIEKIENDILDIKSGISTKYEFRKALKFKILRLKDELCIVNNQIEQLNKSLYFLPSVKKYDMLNDKYISLKNKIDDLYYEIKKLNKILDTTYSERVINEGNRRIENYNLSIKKQLEEKILIKSELINKTLIHRFIKEYDQINKNIQENEKVLLSKFIDESFLISGRSDCDIPSTISILNSMRQKRVILLKYMNNEMLSYYLGILKITLTLLDKKFLLKDIDIYNSMLLNYKKDHKQGASFKSDGSLSWIGNGPRGMYLYFTIVSSSVLKEYKSFSLEK